MPEFALVDAVRLIWSDNGLDLAAKAVAMCLARHADREGCSWPSRTLMAEEASMSPRRVTTALSQLEASGLVRRVNQPGKPTRYYLNPSTTFQGTLAPRARGVEPRARVPWHHVLGTLAPRATEVSHEVLNTEAVAEAAAATLEPRARVDDPDPGFARVEAAYREIRRTNVISSTDLQAIGRALQVATADQIIVAIERVRARQPTRKVRLFRYYEPVIEEVVQEYVTRREIATTRPAGVDPDDPYGGLGHIIIRDPDEPDKPG